MNKAAAIAAALQNLPVDAGADAIAQAIVQAVGPDAALELPGALAQAAWAARQSTP